MRNHDDSVPEVRLALVIFAVQDLPRAVRFYVDAFGWQPTVETSEYVELALPGGPRFGLYDRTRYASNVEGVVMSAPMFGVVSTSELYLYPTDLELTLRNAVRAGARVLSLLTPRTWGDEVAYFADPDDNVIALARPLS